MTPSEAGIAFPARPPIPAGRGVGGGVGGGSRLSLPGMRSFQAGAFVWLSASKLGFFCGGIEGLDGR